ncbi:polysaccharide deacetylase family protein [Aminipila terrae]|uniref:Polysaccharide deacetylase family protein n=1 Tax=Aminipila terrae TaxID=2697030 RepID=A0A6P1MAZ4_9FIRM|nr:polysaccharide deacetylase family protein [Aminipila terrae]QHI71800.1 polysaccharide deacetylase family protein [Aminipila terrae]
MKSRKIAAIIFSLILVLAWGNVCYAGEPAKITDEEHLYVPILMYHHFVEEKPLNGRMDATITKDKLQEDMRYLEENEYTPLLPQDLKAITEGRMKMPEKPVIITFDDGYESAYTVAYPILKETGMKATVFVIVGSVENPRKNEIKKLNWAEMKEMYDSGVFDIQSHSYNLHNQNLKGQYMRFLVNGIQRGLIECRAQYDMRVEEDIVKSIDTIEENVGNKVICYSYPYGAYEEWGKDLLRKNGILFGFGTTYGAGDFKGNLYYLNRFSVGMDTDLSKILN